MFNFHKWRCVFHILHVVLLSSIDTLFAPTNGTITSSAVDIAVQTDAECRLHPWALFAYSRAFHCEKLAAARRQSINYEWMCDGKCIWIIHIQGSRFLLLLFRGVIMYVTLCVCEMELVRHGPYLICVCYSCENVICSSVCGGVCVCVLIKLNYIRLYWLCIVKRLYFHLKPICLWDGE